jgi:hypothetical protein
MKTFAKQLNFALIILVTAIMWGCTGAAGSGSSSSIGSNASAAALSTADTLATYIKASNTDAGDQLGYSVAMSGDGNTLAVGAPSESSAASGINGNQTDNSLPQAGAVYVYVHSVNGWSQQAYIKSSNPDLRDQFGLALALSADGNTLAVGTGFEDSSAKGINGNQLDNNASQSGAVYVFTRNGIVWTQQAYIKASNTETGDEFGLAVTLSGDGNTLAVGAKLEDSSATGINGNQNDNSATDSGAVYIFSRAGTTWSQSTYVKASNTEANDWFGNSVALSSDGNTLAVGANLEDSAATGINGNQGDNSATDSGAVYVFVRSGGTWGQQAYVKASNTDPGDWFGISTSLSGDGNTMIVGACCEDSNAKGLNGNQADNSAPGAGAAYLFGRTAGAWAQQFYVKATNTHSGDEFGHYLAISSDGNTIAIAAAHENSSPNKGPTDISLPQSGAVFLITRSDAGWFYDKFLKAPNADAGDQFGDAVAVSTDGFAVAVGAPLEAGSATGINTNSGDNSAPGAGAAYVY